VRRRGTGLAGGGLLAVLLLAVVGVSGCSAGHTGTGTGAAGAGNGAASAADSFSAGAAGDAARVSAIERIITRTSKSDDSYVQFNDESDRTRDQLRREVQLSCDPSGCIVVVGCDSTGELPCADLAPKLKPLGFFPKQKTYTLGIVGHDDRGNETLAGKPGSAHDFAVLTEKIFLDVLRASRDYALTWQSATQQAPVPVPVESASHG
jgi:hypothetical protein